MGGGRAEAAGCQDGAVAAELPGGGPGEGMLQDVGVGAEGGQRHPEQRIGREEQAEEQEEVSQQALHGGKSGA